MVALLLEPRNRFRGKDASYPFPTRNPDVLLMDVRACVSSKGLPYLLAVPVSPSVDSVPLVVFLHGAGEKVDASRVDPTSADAAWSVLRGFDHETKQWREEYARRTPMGFAADQSDLARNCVVLAPATESGWVLQVPRVLHLIEEVIAGCSLVDPDRVVLTGLSMGGHGVFCVGAAAPSRFAGLSPICGSARRTLLDARFSCMPMWVAHGFSDELIPYESSVGSVAHLREAGNARVVFDGFAAGHDSWSQTYSDPAWWAWMRARRRGALPESEVIRISYRSSWRPAFLAFRADRGPWVTEPEVPTEVASCALPSSVPAKGGDVMLPLAETPETPGWQRIALLASTLEFCLTDGRGSWDNPLGGGNYVALAPGDYVLDEGRLTGARPRGDETLRLPA